MGHPLQIVPCPNRNTAAFASTVAQNTTQNRSDMCMCGPLSLSALIVRHAVQVHVKVKAQQQQRDACANAVLYAAPCAAATVTCRPAAAMPTGTCSNAQHSFKAVITQLCAPARSRAACRHIDETYVARAPVPSSTLLHSKTMKLRLLNWHQYRPGLQPHLQLVAHTERPAAQHPSRSHGARAPHCLPLAESSGACFAVLPPPLARWPAPAS